MAIKILIADDHDVVRAGLKAMFDKSPLKVVGEASDGITGYKLAKKIRPDVVLLDVRMPGGDGLTCLGRLRLDFPDIPVLMFSSFDNPTYLARALALGASGYILKNATREKLIQAIQTVASGESIWVKDDLRRVTGALAAPTVISDNDVPLTKREGEVLKQIALGLTNKEIAQGLGISYETVKEHVQHILQKLNVTDRTQAAVWAVRKDLL